MIKKYKIIVVLIILALLPIGCMVGPKYVKPEQQEATSYKYGPAEIDTLASVTNLKWFDLFNDEVLVNLITKGLENNYDLKIAVARIDRLRAELGMSKTNLYPSIGYGGQANFGNDTAQNFYPSNVGVSLSWELDFWGKFRHENNAVQSQLLATEEGRKVVLSNIVSQIATAYFQLRNLDNQLVISNNTLETRKKAFDIINARFKAGYVSEVDKVQIEQQVAIAEGVIPRIKREITFQENVISILLGQAPGPIPRGKTSSELQIVGQIPISIPSSLLENRPDVKAAELLYKESNERIGVAVAMRYPSINLAAVAGFASANISDLFLGSSYVQNVGGGILGPIFAFGKNKRRVDAYIQQAEENKLSFQKTYITAVSEVEQAIQNIKTYDEEWLAVSKEVNAAQINYNLSYARYNNGYTEYLEVLNAETNLFDAQLNQSQLTERKLSSMVVLYKALGGGWN
jgi:multidrug efflux system outer membrane protein